MESRVERRLAAILCADVVGYSRLIEQDEAGTIGALQEPAPRHRRPAARPTSWPTRADHRRRHPGRVRLRGRRRAVRGRGAGGGCRTAGGRPAGTAPRAADRRQSRRRGRRRRPTSWAMGSTSRHGWSSCASPAACWSPRPCASMSATASISPSRISGRRRSRTSSGRCAPIDCCWPDQQPASAAIIAGPWPARVERSKPSVAVLPFENLSRDPDQDYFSEGIAEDLITDLSKISGLQVAGRRSTFAARQTARDAVEASARLQVGHVLEGSIRRAGNRIRITARLVDGATGAQVWAERYDRTLDDIFAVQDDITQQIVAALQVKLLPTEKAGPGAAADHQYRGLRRLPARARAARPPRQAVLQAGAADVRARRRIWTRTSLALWPGSRSATAISTCISAGQRPSTMFSP